MKNIHKNIFRLAFAGLLSVCMAGCNASDIEPTYATAVAGLVGTEADFYLYDDYTKYFREDISKKEISLLKYDYDNDTYKSVTDFTFSFYDEYTLDIKTTLASADYEPDYIVKIDKEGTTISKPVYAIYGADNFYIHNPGTEDGSEETDFLCSVALPGHLPIPTTTRTETTTTTVNIEKKTDEELLIEGSEVGKSPNEEYHNFADITITSTYEETVDSEGNLLIKRLISRKWKIAPYHLDSSGKSYPNRYILYNVRTPKYGAREYYWGHPLTISESTPYAIATYICSEVNAEDSELWTVEVMMMDSDRANSIQESQYKA